jgi:hypothetical protein
MRAMRKVVLIAGVVFVSSAAAMAQNISNSRDGTAILSAAMRR